MPIFNWNGTPGTSSDWTVGSNWVGGVAPNGTDATVIFPVITATTTGSPASYFITVAANETLAAASVSLASFLTINGTLNVLGGVAYNGGEIDMGGGTLRLGALDDTNGYDIQGNGTISSGNSIVNAGLIIGNGLTFNVAGFSNAGTFEASSGSLTLNVTSGAGGFANFNAGLLTGGSYGALNAGTLLLNIGGAITTDAANITLSGATAAINQIVGANTSALASTLSTIAATGTLTIAGSANYVTTNTLDVLGTLVMGSTAATSFAQGLSSGTLTAGILRIAAGGRVVGIGRINGPVSGMGTVEALGDSLTLAGSTASALEISAGTLELGAAASGTVTFTDTSANLAQTASIVAGQNPYAGWLPSSTLTLDAATAFTASIAGFSTPSYFSNRPRIGGRQLNKSPDQIVLPGISLSSIANLAYTPSGNGGVLSFQAGTSAVSLAFTGSYHLADFVLSAGTQLYSNSLPSVVITDPAITLAASAADLLIAEADPAQALANAAQVTLIGTDNTLSAANAAVLAAMPGFGLAAGADLVVSDTPANLLANPTGLAFATGIVVIGTNVAGAAWVVQQITSGGFYTASPNVGVVSNSATAAATLFGAATDGELVISGSGGLAFKAGAGAGTVLAAGGNNLISVYPGAGAQNIATGRGNDTIAVLSGANTIAAGAGTNLIFAQGGNDLITSSGLDLIDVPDGNSTINAGTNAPTIFLGSGRSQINAGQGNATVVVGAGAATVNSAGAGQIWMQAGGGVVNSQRADTVIGGTGVVTVNAGSADDFVFAGPGLLDFVGGSGVSTLLGASAGSASISGGAGSVIAVAYGATSFVGGAGAATVAAYGGSVTISGGTGTGVFLGGPAGGNRMAGGSGHATLIGGGAGDVLTAWTGGGTVLQAGSGAETLTALGSTGRNNFYGGAGPDLIVLGGGGDQVLAGAGAATMVGGAGADLFAFMSGNQPNVVIQNFVPGQDYVALLGFGSAEATKALSSAVTVSGSEQVTLSDGTRIQFLGVTGLQTSNFL